MTVRASRAVLSRKVQGSHCGWSGSNQKHCRRRGQGGRREQDHEGLSGGLDPV